jgi:hypothetical protein
MACSFLVDIGAFPAPFGTRFPGKVRHWRRQVPAAGGPSPGNPRNGVGNAGPLQVGRCLLPRPASSPGHQRLERTNRPIHQLQLLAKIGNDFGNVHETRAANEFVAANAVHGPTLTIEVMEDARTSLQFALLMPIVNRAWQAHGEDDQSKFEVLPGIRQISAVGLVRSDLSAYSGSRPARRASRRWRAQLRLPRTTRTATMIRCKHSQ